ncbi:MAG: hypothetical protein K8R64_03825 [Methanosarcinaceae archaeon]|nr:hypothetical protein [Methanosarcinaceae archaeon]
MKVELTVDGKEIEINNFVQRILGSITASSVETLHGVDSDWKNISIDLKQ